VSACALLLACALSASCPHTARASDFWDSVRGTSRGRPTTAERLRRARTALQANQAQVALAAIGTVHTGEPREAELLIVRGRAQALATQTREALASYEHAATLLNERDMIAEPDALAMARLSLQAGRYPLALRALAGHADQAERPQARAALRVIEAHAVQAMGPEHLERAIASYREALRAVPNHASALLGLSLALHRQGAEAAALTIAKRVRDPAQLDRSLLENALPRAERSARTALFRESILDLSAARAAWHEAMQFPGPWREHARMAVQRLDAAHEPAAAKREVP